MNLRSVAVFALIAGAAGLASCRGLWQPKPAQSASAERGKQIYERHCIACHAPRATGDAFLAVPALAGQRREYLQLQIERFSTDERHSAQMDWAFKRSPMDLSQAAADIAAYLSDLPVTRFADADLRFQAEGEAIFAAQCAACHAADARGNPIGAIPSIRAQHDSYLVNRLHRFASVSPTVVIPAHRIDDHAVIAVSAYLSSLEGAPH